VSFIFSNRNDLLSIFIFFIIRIPLKQSTRYSVSTALVNSKYTLVRYSSNNCNTTTNFCDKWYQHEGENQFADAVEGKAVPVSNDEALIEVNKYMYNYSLFVINRTITW
jgi:hypothetical protein